MPCMFRIIFFSVSVCEIGLTPDKLLLVDFLYKIKLLSDSVRLSFPSRFFVTDSAQRKYIQLMEGSCC